MQALLRHLAAAILAVAAATASADIDLPAMGSPIDQVLSPREEAAIGAEMMARARQHLQLNDDPEVADYIDGLGRRLTSGVDNAPPDGFQFFVVHDRRINAFAAPGGYIGLNSGLVLAAKNEAQLAGVIAHEVAHVTQRHIAKAYAANQRGQYTTLATILAALILGSQNPEAAEAAITTGVAAQAQRRINYTRANEYEADRIGIGILAGAGYDPGGMAGMFELLMESAGSSADAVPEFLRTHPLSSNRIAEAQDRAARMKTTGSRSDSLEFHLMQRRLRVLEADQPQVLRSRWETEDVAAGTHAAAARAYGLALLERRTGDPGAAVERLEALRGDAPDNLHYGLALARAHAHLERPERALEVWRHFDAIYPGSYAVVDTGADLLTAADRPADALDRVTTYLRRTKDAPPEAWRRQAEAAEAAGRSVLSHEALGEYYVRIGRFDHAMRQFELGLDAAEAGSPDALRLEARLEQVRARQRERVADNPVSGQ